MKPAVVTSAPVRHWRCDVCKTFAPWSRGWARYSPIRVEEDCGHGVTTCSDGCRSSEVAAFLVKEFEREHPMFGTGARGGCLR